MDEMWDFFDRAMAKVLAPSSGALRDAGWEMTITRQRHHFGIILFYTSEIIRRLSGSVWDPRIHRQALRSLKLIATSQPCVSRGSRRCLRWLTRFWATDTCGGKGYAPRNAPQSRIPDARRQR